MGGITNSIFGPGQMSSNPISQTTSTPSIQSWANPYISNYLGQAQNLVNQGVQYNPLQQQSYAAAANLGPSTLIGQGAGYANQAIQGAFGTVTPAMQYGTLGANYGQTGANYGANAAQIGSSYGLNATNPAAVQAYMNPYLEATLKPSMQLLNQQFGQQQMQNQAQATQQGAYGGGRQAVMQGLNQQNQDLATNQLVSNAYNQAYQQANQNMQQAATLGMQGAGMGITGAQAGMQGAGVGLQGVTGAQNAYGLGLQGAGVLGTLGQEQFNQQLAAAQFKNQLGMQQYQMPQQLLQFGQGMISNLPFTTTTAQGNQAPPNIVSQLSGLGLTAAAIASLYGGKTPTGATGGLPEDFKEKKMAKGGIAKAKHFAIGGGIASGVPAGQLPYMLSALDDAQLQQKTMPPTDPATMQAAIGQEAFRQQMRAPGMAANPVPTYGTPSVAANNMGIAQANMTYGPSQQGIAAAPMGQTTFNAAGGGIVAFADNPDQPVKVGMPATAGSYTEPTAADYATNIGARTAALKDLYGQNVAGQEFKQKLQDMYANMGQESKEQGLWRLAQMGLGIAGSTSPWALTNISQGAQPAVAGMMEDIRQQKKEKLDLTKAQYEIGQNDYKTNMEIVNNASKNYDAELNRHMEMGKTREKAAADIKAAQISAGATMYAADREMRERKEGVNVIKQGLLAQGYPDNANTDAIAFTKFKELGKPYGGVSMINAETEAIAKDPKLTALYKQKKLLDFTGTDAEKAKIDAEIATQETAIRNRVRSQGPINATGAPTGVGGVPTPVPVPNAPIAPIKNADGSITIPGKGTFKQLPNGNYVPI